VRGGEFEVLEQAELFGVGTAGAAPAVLMAKIDLARSEAVRRIWPFLRDRRIDAYNGLLRRYCDQGFEPADG
jgi:predicted amidohydrolase